MQQTKIHDHGLASTGYGAQLESGVQEVRDLPSFHYYQSSDGKPVEASGDLLYDRVLRLLLSNECAHPLFR